MATEIRVPTLGESVTEATIGKWLKKPGDTVKADEPLVELETDKVSMEVPAPSDGVLESIEAQEGDTVGIDALLGSLGAGSGKAAAAAPSESKAEPVAKSSSDGSSDKDGGEMVDIIAPSAGESVTEAEVGTWHKKVGDAVDVDEEIVELETDKAAMDVPATRGGVLAEIVAQTGAIIAPGDVLGRIQVGGTVTDTSRAEAARKGEGSYGGETANTVPAASKTETASYTQPTPPGDMAPSPAAAKMIAEKNVDSTTIEGSGKRGQVLKGDVIAALESGASSIQARHRTRASRSVRCRRRIPRGTRPHDAPAPDHRTPPERGAGFCRHADHLQRGGYGPGHGPA